MRTILEYHLQNKKLAHGYLLYGEREAALTMIAGASREIFGTDNIRQNPDFFSYSFDKFGIEQSRTIIDLAAKKSFGGTAKIFQLEFREATREAQNALLKLFEEPAPNTYFFVYAPASENIIGTLRSRLIPIFVPLGHGVSKWKEGELAPLETKFLTGLAEKFFKMDFNEKLDFFGKIKDGEAARNLILELMAELQKNKPLTAESCGRIKKLEDGLKLLSQNIPASLVGLYVLEK